MKITRVKNVSYAKGLQYNLIAISQMCDIGYEVHFNKRDGKVIDKKFTLVITNEYSRFTWVVFLRKKNHATNEIISLIKHCEVLYNQKVRNYEVIMELSSKIQLYMNFVML